uniref:C2H2-type domain-containing protein n=1 Tax=Eptatretus burgeri TaxID=7764 RepID=A0A8C4R435_EPTBU
MDLSRTRGNANPTPDWLASQGFTEEVLQAAVTELGTEILGALCARAEPAPVRLRLCSLVARKFTFTMYAELCHYMELCSMRRQLESTNACKCGKDAEETGGPVGKPSGILQIKAQDEASVDPGEEGINPEHVEKEKLVGKFTCSLCFHNLTTTAALKMHMWQHQPVSGDENYKCPDCAFITCCRSVYVTHTRIHSRKKPCTCSVCGNGFNLFT